MFDVLYIPIGVILLGLLQLTYRAYTEGNPVLGGNAVASIVAICIPLVIELVSGPLVGISIDIGPVMPLWIAIAGGLHTIGMTTVYERVWWWDHLTHTVSAGLVAAVVYGALLAIDADPATSELGWPTIAGATVGVTLLAGVLWELIELVGRDLASAIDQKPMLIPYGRFDTALDIVFDGVGAILIILLDIRTFVSLAEQSPATAAALLELVGWAMVIVTASLAVALVVGHRVTSQ